mmetsp:Transcript_19308/g.42076  ORF Transcript_19308/g.42076 Transcript_19308/m.42076 type:complete len:413 (+) Transcript_19308:85-1323(+)
MTTEDNLQVFEDDVSSFLVVVLPALAMSLGSTFVFCARVPGRLQACMQMFSAGLLISAVAGELFPLIAPGKASSRPQPSTLVSYVALIGGFTAGLLFMFGLEHITESFDPDDDASSDGDEGDLSARLLSDDSDSPDKMSEFRSYSKELRQEAGNLLRLLSQGSHDNIDESIHGMEFRVHRAERHLTPHGPLEPYNLARMKFHAKELCEAGETLQQTDSIRAARHALLAFDGCLQHLHSHAERGKFQRWKPSPPPLSMKSEIFSEKLPWPLVAAVTIDAAVDGLLVGLSFSASASAGWTMSLATCIEMGFLGLSFSASLMNSTKNRRKQVSLSVIPPVMLLLMGISGNVLGHLLSESPGVFIGFVAFSIVALLFLVTQELLAEAHELAKGSALINAMFFVGLLAGILLEKLLD